MAKDESPTKAKMILATLDLLRASGLAGAGINSIVEAGGAPKGSVYHFFPAGKHALVTAALREAEQAVGEGFRTVFSQSVPVSQKVRMLFHGTAGRLEASGFLKGCPVAAVTLDLDESSADLRTVCEAVFRTWREVIAAGLDGVPENIRHDVAQLILAALEGALVLARAQASPAPLEETGALLATALSRVIVQPRRRAQVQKRAGARRKTRRSRGSIRG
jgi:TetR/AcrR family transcriptional regulator, lmrAB and yxaGH operons repressor